MVGILATLIYVALPAVSTAFAWFNSPDQAMSFFFLWSLTLWLAYLQSHRQWTYWLAIAFAVLALLNKEIAAAIPIVLLLADRWLDAQPIDRLSLARRYFPFAILWAIYAGLTWQRLGIFMSAERPAQYGGLGIGSHILTNLLAYLTALILPWQIPAPIDYIMILIAIVILGLQFFFRHNRRVVFLSVGALLTLAPALLFAFVAPRYLYLPLTGSAIMLAWACRLHSPDLVFSDECLCRVDPDQRVNCFQCVWLSTNI